MRNTSITPKEITHKYDRLVITNMDNLKRHGEEVTISTMEDMEAINVVQNGNPQKEFRVERRYDAGGSYVFSTTDTDKNGKPKEMTTIKISHADLKEFASVLQEMLDERTD